MIDSLFLPPSEAPGEVLCHISYIGVQTKPIRGVAFATTAELLPTYSLFSDDILLLARRPDALPPEVFTISASEMAVLLTTVDGIARLTDRAVDQPFFRVAVLRRLDNGNHVAYDWVVAEDEADGFLRSIETAIDAHAANAQNRLGRLRREALSSD
jgi:hypothetical protein